MQRMTRIQWVAATIALLVAAGPATAGHVSADAKQAVLTPFGSDEKLDAFLAKVTDAQRRHRLRAEAEEKKRVAKAQREHDKKRARLLREQRNLRERQQRSGDDRIAERLKRIDLELFVLRTMSPGQTVQTETSSTTSSANASITNVQDAGVDEGGLVKRHGDHLVVLRRGRLFTIAIDGGQLQPVAAVDAFDSRLAVTSDPFGTWYDELLVSGDTVVVIGYSYDRAGSEIGLFDIDRAGHLQHRATYHLRSNDYYSWRNYSSRLVGTRLVFSTPSRFDGESTGGAGFPELRKWRPGATEGEYQRVAAGARVYGPSPESLDPANLPLHAVTTCDLAAREFTCEATVVIGASSEEFYVTQDAVYLWSRDEGRSRQASDAILYRIPTDGAAPTALRVRGRPFDQFSFLERDGHLNVVVGLEHGDEYGDFDIALLRIPLESLGDGRASAPGAAYRPITRCEGPVSNRFVGDSLLVSCGNRDTGGDVAAASSLNVFQQATGYLTRIPVEVWVSRIEPIGKDALIVGGRAPLDLRFTTVRLDDRAAAIVDAFTYRGAAESEARSHAFGFAPLGAADGLLGLPVVANDTGDLPGAARGAVVFLRSQSLMLTDVGSLATQSTETDDECRASCVDWYGTSRPFFIGSRVFALLGYEIIEGELAGGLIRERVRTNFAPPPAPPTSVQ